MTELEELHQMMAIKAAYKRGWADSAKRNCHPDSIDESSPENANEGALRYLEELNTPKYTHKVKFSKTNRYGCGPDHEDDVYTVAEFLEHVDNGSFIDYDGHGYPVKDKLADKGRCILPSEAKRTIPKDATHILWCNK